MDPATLSTGSGSSAGDSRTDLLTEIRQGIELRPPSARDFGNTDGQRDTKGTDALADILRKALTIRAEKVQLSDEENEESDDGEWDD